jgi:hypothetical protein
MSLFSAREWWVAPYEEDEYDTNSLLVANFDCDGGDDLVLTGSLSGVRDRLPPPACLLLLAFPLSRARARAQTPL